MFSVNSKLINGFLGALWKLLSALNGSGVIDAWLIDENNNGVYEIAYGDKNEDGIITFAGLANNGLSVIGAVVGICGYLCRIYVRSVLIFRNLFRN